MCWDSCVSVSIDQSKKREFLHVICVELKEPCGEISWKYQRQRKYYTPGDMFFQQTSREMSWLSRSAPLFKGGWAPHLFKDSIEH